MRFKRRQSKRAFTLVEFMISIGIMGLITAALMSFMSFSARNFASIYGYIELNNESKQAIDILTRDIRQVTQVSSYSSNEIDFLWTSTNGVNNHVKFAYSPTARTLTRSYNYGTPQVLLTGCDTLPGTNFFRVYQRTPQAATWNNYDPSTNNFNVTAKVVMVSWKSTRRNVADLLTETVQTAKIVIRSQH